LPQNQLASLRILGETRYLKYINNVRKLENNKQNFSDTPKIIFHTQILRIKAENKGTPQILRTQRKTSALPETKGGDFIY